MSLLTEGLVAALKKPVTMKLSRDNPRSLDQSMATILMIIFVIAVKDINFGFLKIVSRYNFVWYLLEIYVHLS